MAYGSEKGQTLGGRGEGLHARSHDGSHDGPHDGRAQHLPEALLERFEDENDFLRRELERLHRELERKDAILLTMAQHIPELEPAREAPSEPREAPETVSEERGGGDGPPEAGGREKRSSWWRRFFGLENPA